MFETSEPEVAAIGVTEAQARAAGTDVAVVDYDLGWVAGASLYADGYAGRARMVVDEGRGVVIGMTLVGPAVAELLHAATIAVVGEVVADAVLPPNGVVDGAAHRAPAVDIPLHLRVVEPFDAADLRAVQTRRRHLAARVEMHVPHERRADLPLEQARRTFTEFLGVQRNPHVGHVDRLPATARLGVESAAGTHVQRHIGDGVAHVETLAVTLQVHGLIEVHRTGRVDREERHGRLVALRFLDMRERVESVGHGVGRVVGGQLVLGAQGLERARELAGGVGVLQQDACARHGPSLRGERLGMARSTPARDAAAPTARDGERLTAGG